MPRFSDEWVVDRTMFEFVSGGSCACCGMNHLFLPDGLKGLINSISDLETDAANNELSAAEKSPWPPNMRDEVWGDRVRLRHKMKKDMKVYKDFFEEEGRENVEKWCRDEIGASGLKKLFQMPRSEVSEVIRTKYGIHGAFAIVLCAVMEQVVNFKATGYETDGRSPEEIAFEQNLTFDRRGGFTIPITEMDASKNLIINDDGFQMFFDMMVSLGGPKLLARGPKTTVDEDDDEGGADDPDDLKPSSGPSFRADRRIVRLLIARYWADLIISRFHASKMDKN